jgi:hypothetical protein
MPVDGFQSIVRTGWFKTTTRPYKWGHPILITNNDFSQDPRNHFLGVKKTCLGQCALPDFSDLLILRCQNLNFRVHDTMITAGHIVI